MAWPKTSRDRVRLVWMIAGCLVFTIVAVAFVRINNVHVANVRGTKLEGNFVVVCDIVNPMKETVTVVATSTIYAPSANRQYGIDQFPPMQQTIELNGNETITIEFSHPCDTPGHRVRPNVAIKTIHETETTN